MTPETCKTARDLLGWTLVRVSLETDVDPAAIFLYEHREERLSAESLSRIRATLERAGIEFVDTACGEPRAHFRAGALAAGT